MKQSINNFLEFNGKNIIFLSKDGVYWIAIKPICEALNIDYIQQFKNVNLDVILSSKLCKHTMQLPNVQARKMICLPEKYIYGWIFSIRSESKELLEYKKQCYEILFDHFHGTITNRKELLQEKITVRQELVKIENELKANPVYIKLNNLKAEQMRLGKALLQNDNEIISQQLNLVFQE